MNMGKLRFGHVAFRVSDVQRSVAWYQKAFNARKIYHAAAEGDRPELMFMEFAKGQFIEFFTGGRIKAQQSSDTMGYLHFCLIVDDLDQALRHLDTLGVHPNRGPFIGRARQPIAFIADPDGNIIELMQIPRESPLYRE